MDSGVISGGGTSKYRAWDHENFCKAQDKVNEHSHGKQTEVTMMELSETIIDPYHGLHGVLKYARETKAINISSLPKSYDPREVECEFCGDQATPSLNLLDTGSVIARKEDFCCNQYKELYEKVTQQSSFIRERCAKLLKSHASNLQDAQELENKLVKAEIRLQQLEMEKYSNEVGAKSTANLPFIINFKLSTWSPEIGSKPVRMDLRKEQEFEELEYEHIEELATARFGLWQRQDSSNFVLKFYSTGNTFLMSFPDGSAQVFYPSGNLALIILVDDKGAICIVYDDIMLRSPMRALIQSSGKATCYHGNGNIWLSIDTWGGMTLDERGAKTRKWIWAVQAHVPTPLRPIYLPLNRYAAVRVFGRESIFISFLASGQQARFSVGSRTEPLSDVILCRQLSLSKEELMAQVFHLYVRLALARVRWCRCWRSDSDSDLEHPLPRPPPFFQSKSRRILRLSSRVRLEDEDRDFIQAVLQDNQ